MMLHVDCVHFDTWVFINTLNDDNRMMLLISKIDDDTCGDVGKIVYMLLHQYELTCFMMITYVTAD